MTYFGTDGIRQEASKFTPDFLNQIALGLTEYAGTDIKVLLGGDTRESTEWILQDLAAALESLGVEYSSVGVLPTPAINFCFYEMGFDFAIDVTASHNPYTDNGIKIFERGPVSGIKLGPAGCTAIENRLISPKPFNLLPITDREDLHTEALALYKEHLLNYLKIADFTGLSLGLDCANGATSVINKQIFEELGAKVSLIHADENYNQTINLNCGSTHPESLKELVLSNHLDFGIAYDGDGDRTILIDSKGHEVDGDDILAILANFLNLNQIVVTVMANQGLLNWAKDHNIKTEITSVGDSNVATAMRENDIELGGEQSGHIILPGEPTGDGMLTSLMLTKVISESNTPLCDLAIEKLPQFSTTVPATPEQKSLLKSSEAVQTLLLQFNEKLQQVHGRLLVRPSGTEPKIRIALWGDNLTTINALADELVQKLTNLLGA